MQNSKNSCEINSSVFDMKLVNKIVRKIRQLTYLLKRSDFPMRMPGRQETSV
jgi:hypothetical protein